MEYSHKKRLLLFMPLPPPFHGSNIICRYVADCIALREQYDVKLFPLRYAATISDIGSFRLSKLWVFFKNIVLLTYLVIMQRPNFIYFVPAVTGFPFLRECVYVLIFKLFKIPVIYHLHGKGIRDSIEKPIMKRIYTWFFHGEHIINLAPILYEDIADVVPNHQVSFIANGIKIPDGLVLREHVCPSDRKVTILFFSNLIISKGPIVLLDALVLLKEQAYDFKAVFVGNPSKNLTKETFEDHVKQRNLENYVHYIGPMYGEEKTQILTDSDILTLPTMKDCFPLIVLEAMACGLPVVTTKEGAISDIIEDGVHGFIVPHNDSVTLANRLALLISNPEKRRILGEAGRQKYMQHYRLEVFEQKLVAVMNSIINSQ